MSRQKYHRNRFWEEDDSYKPFEIRVGWMCAALTIAIIAIRAFQSNAEPMSSWSVTSWLLMTLPMTFPIYIWLVLMVLKLIITICFCFKRK